MNQSITRVIVAGGAGFIGKNLILRLLNSQKFFVICIDNFSSSLYKDIPDYIIHNPNFLLLNQDVCDLDVSAVEFSNIGRIYNLASIASPKIYIKNGIQTIKTNTLGVIKLLEISKRNDSIFFQASTSEVYGDPLEHPQKESYYGNVNSYGPRSCYDEGKRVAETLCYEYKNTFGLKIKIARIFNTYGPYMNHEDGRVMQNFFSQMIEKRPITIYGDGSATRSFMYIDDLLDGIELLIKSEYFLPINLGNPSEVSIMELVHTINLVLGDNSGDLSISFLPKLQDDPMKRRPDISIANDILAWYPKISLQEGIRLAFNNFKISYTKD